MATRSGVILLTKTIVGIHYKGNILDFPYQQYLSHQLYKELFAAGSIKSSRTVLDCKASRRGIYRPYFAKRGQSPEFNFKEAKKKKSRYSRNFPLVANEVSEL